MALHIALPNRLFDQLGLRGYPGWERNLNHSNRRMRTRLSSGVGGGRRVRPVAPYPDSGQSSPILLEQDGLPSGGELTRHQSVEVDAR
jgi:hypothetical protein